MEETLDEFENSLSTRTVVLMVSAWLEMSCWHPEATVDVSENNQKICFTRDRHISQLSGIEKSIVFSGRTNAKL